MEPPSSPPTLSGHASTRLTTSEETLPPPARPQFHGLLPSKKRRRDDFVYENSSDPAVFSSDDLHASLENYCTQRKKRPLVGTWWKATEMPQRTSRKRGFERNFDSGVFMGCDNPSSDSLDVPSDYMSPDPTLILPSINAQTSGPSTLPSQQASNSDPMCDTDSALDVDLSAGQTSRTLPEDLAEEIVGTCVDAGNSAIDLYNLRLERLRPSTIDMMSLITVQAGQSSHPEPEDYKDLVPDLQLYLSSNELKKLPPQICSLKNLQRLTLRNNMITSLPPQIGQVDNLRSLNVAVNRLAYLPASLLPRIKDNVTDVLCRSNPLAIPVSRIIGRYLIERSHRAQGDEEFLFACSTICYFESNGRPLHPSENPPPSLTPEMFTPGKQQQPPPSTSKAHTLTELALRNCDAIDLLAAISTLTPTDYPAHLLPLCKRAEDAQAAGLQVCDECGERFIIPRAEWLEFWIGGKLGSYNPVPFLKQVCSWTCAKPGVVRDLIGCQGQSWYWKDCGWTVPRHYTDL